MKLIVPLGCPDPTVGYAPLTQSIIKEHQVNKMIYKVHILYQAIIFLFLSTLYTFNNF